MFEGIDAEPDTKEALLEDVIEEKRRLFAELRADLGE